LQSPALPLGYSAHKWTHIIAEPSAFASEAFASVVRISKANKSVRAKADRVKEL
jgi:hypothetical protein